MSWLCASVCVCLSLAAFPHYCTECKLGNGRGRTLVVRYWAHLQSVHGFRCYDNIAPNVKCQRVLVLSLCLVMKTVAARQKQSRLGYHR